MKRILMIAMTLILGSGALWLFAQTNVPPTSAKVLYYTCPMHPSVKSDKPGDCPICGMTLQPVYADSDTTMNEAPKGTNNAAATDNKPLPYPFSTCIVDGMQLDSMGGPYVFVYQGQEIKLCCANCKPAFLNNPGPYIKKIQDAEAKK